MKMTLEDAKYCIGDEGLCDECRLREQTELDCRKEAFEIAAACINYCLVGKKLTSELEGKER